MMRFIQHSPERQSENLELWSKFHEVVVKAFEQYQLPVIELGKSTPRQAVCQVFEKVNTGGVTLTVFELLTATFAADVFDLRQDWADRRAQWAGKYGILSEVANTDFLQAVTLLATYERHRAATRPAGTKPPSRASAADGRTCSTSSSLSTASGHPP
ncbi:hypothetical protein [Saccharothrix sp.]|uniref:hypothetical protein n=1 Tax=Saccharothrix sp. TaxID=1873460 RepID=UPI00281236C4|nr:hypothetical protein [Saccharothrix sp.]